MIIINIFHFSIIPCLFPFIINIPLTNLMLTHSSLFQSPIHLHCLSIHLFYPYVPRRIWMRFIQSNNSVSIPPFLWLRTKTQLLFLIHNILLKNKRISNCVFLFLFFYLHHHPPRNHEHLHEQVCPITPTAHNL